MVRYLNMNEKSHTCVRLIAFALRYRRVELDFYLTLVEAAHNPYSLIRFLEILDACKTRLPCNHHGALQSELFRLVVISLMSRWTSDNFDRCFSEARASADRTCFSQSGNPNARARAAQARWISMAELSLGRLGMILLRSV